MDKYKISKDKKIKNGIDKFILSVTENGYGKRSSYLDYRVTNRGGKGIIGIIRSAGTIDSIKTSPTRPDQLSRVDHLICLSDICQYGRFSMTMLGSKTKPKMISVTSCCL